MPDHNPQIAVIILAAGASARMGKPKQLLNYNSTTLLGNAVAGAQTLGSPIVVVTGAAHNEITAAINQAGIQLIYNPDWQTGMASSLRAGLTALENHPEITGAMILLCDQPLITARHLQALYQTFLAHQCRKIIATAYEDVLGVPALFPRAAFNRLLQLSGDEGARKLLRHDQENVTGIPFSGASLDIDTPGDYEKLALQKP